MEFTNLQLIIVAVCILLVGLLLGRFMRKREGESFFARIFKDNKDFDTTLDRVIMAVILLFMLVAFHDDFTDPTRAAQITVIFLGLINLYSMMVTGKTVRDMQNGNGQISPNKEA